MYIITNSSLCCFVIPVVSAINAPAWERVATKVGADDVFNRDRRQKK